MGLEVAAVHFKFFRKEEGFKEKVHEKLLETLKETERNLRKIITADFDGDGDLVDVANKLFVENNRTALQVRLMKVRDDIESLSSMDLSRKSKVEVGALVTVDDDGKERIFLVVPESFSGFETVEVDGKVVYTLSPKAPLYASLKDREAGEELYYDGEKMTIVEVV